MIVIFFPSSKESHNSTYFFLQIPSHWWWTSSSFVYVLKSFCNEQIQQMISCQEFRYCFSSWWQNGPLAMYFFFSFSFTHIQGQGSWSKCFMVTWKKLSLKVLLVDDVVVSFFFSYNILPHIVKAFWNNITFFISFSPMYNVCFVVFSMCVHYKSWIGAVWTSE